MVGSPKSRFCTLDEAGSICNDRELIECDIMVVTRSRHGSNDKVHYRIHR